MVLKLLALSLVLLVLLVVLSGCVRSSSVLLRLATVIVAVLGVVALWLDVSVSVVFLV